MDSTTTIATSLVEPRRRSSAAWSQSTSLLAQLNGPRQQAAPPARRKRRAQAAREFEILDEEPERTESATVGTMVSQATAPAPAPAPVARSRRSRTSIVAALNPVHEDADTLPAIAEDGEASTQITREPRRRTIFVPSDDTTISTIHPGMKAREDKAERGLELTAAARLRRPARTSLLAAPRRGPLQSVKAPQTANNVMDRNGRATGKENVAPGQLATCEEEKPAPPMTRARMSLAGRRDSVLLAKAPSTNISIAVPKDRTSRVQTRSPETQGREKVPKLSVASKTMRPIVSQAKPALNLRNYPPIEENITHARMFEESWLNNQEYVLVELINDVFTRSEENRKAPRQKILRDRLLHFYQDKNTLRLHQRLQASLQFGTLSVAKDSEGAAEAYRYAKDVGRRERFVKLWTQAYQPIFLRAALEVIVGRQMATEAGSQCSSRDVSTFIDGFLLKNQDAETPAHLRGSTESTAWSWRRTMQRSLMLVYLLDKAKEMLSQNGNLFRKTSSFKSSVAVLNELSRTLHPSERNTQHCLSHLGYKVSHEQHLLADYSWSITKLASDLRDGMRLAHLVELLLPPCHPEEADFDRRPSWGSSNADTSDPTNPSRYLSPHLRMPCTSRVAMIANNDLILDALRTSHSLGAATREISAGDLVDGHREKTLALLWALLGTAGLERMVDWEDLESEVADMKTQTQAGAASKDSTTDSSPSPNSHLAQLRAWTSLIAAKHGLTVPNYSTAFSDGRIFEAVVDEYAPLLPSLPSCQKRDSLEAKLMSLGCTPTFASIFGSGSTRFIDADFTTAALLFLASRLLGGSRTERHRRAMLKRLAGDCATVVQTKLRLEDAAIVLQRRWRIVAASKREQRKQAETTRIQKERNVLAAEVDVDFWMV